MYIRTSKRPRDARLKAVGIACAVVVVLAIGIQLLVPHFVPALFTTVARPFWRIEFSAASGSLDSPQALLAQNEELKRQLVALMVEGQSVQAVRSENDQLLSLLGRAMATSTETASSSPLSATSSSIAAFSYPKLSVGRTLAAVLARPPFAPYDELIIDIGADHGLVAGAKVYSPGNVLIGTTTDVFSQTAKVALLSSPGETYPVLIGPGNVPAMAVGRGGGQYGAQVPQASSVKPGDAVSDSSLSDSAFGIVTAVLADPAEPFETVLFAPPVNVYQLRWVFVDASSAAVSTIKLAPAKVPAKR